MARILRGILQTPVDRPSSRYTVVKTIDGRLGESRRETPIGKAERHREEPAETKKGLLGIAVM